MLEADEFQAGDIVDLNDRFTGWRGRYIVMEKKVITPLIKIKNQGTNSMQFVNANNLRKSRLPQFSLKILQSLR